MSTQQELINHLKETLSKIELSQNIEKVNSSPKNGHTAFAPKDFKHSPCKMPLDELLECGTELIDFQYANPTTYHAIKGLSDMLVESGFKYIDEKDDWSSLADNPGYYYTTRNGTSLSAFIIGPDWKPEFGVGVVASHIDSLTAKLKPSSLKEKVEGFDLLGVAPYGGTLNELWFDRDLGIGGRVLVTESGSDKVKSVLIDSTPHPIARIPSLAPHFGSPAVGPFDKEDQAVPIVGYVSPEEAANAPEVTDEEKKSPLYGKHCINLLRWVAKQAGVKVSELVQMDLELFDVQKGTFGGIKNDFLFIPRLDDRLCSFAAIGALHKFATLQKPNPEDFTMVCLFDNEEVGSLTRQGAQGGLLSAVVSRVAKAMAGSDAIDLHRIFANSIILSADVNHMFNPNFKNVYMSNHSPKPNVGITLSLDPNAHMATDVVGTAFVERLAAVNDDKVQYFQIKNNSRSGGTVGPFLASQTGARTVDLGIAQLSMHSIRATTGSQDVGLGAHFFCGFYMNWRRIYNEFNGL
ncbi:hypothetical protein TBLA_0I01160 [Henningerozyma blattae CBS 6284]|uniref:Uncharacterized protein n=1 Tax=Henningerozyma blattae (strain ATCC 34711 / CBS 6284 / DSM 70876 / NBRC 10599 / NRRL Y-10934 / UCD 77-7) TaxID=1071380 RepID=I2H8S4_HENB6|nr:hypothetical protein TBLA_0I01160 [Tetrapisispora blattae CBS 6284]CCH62776.1 hypothetical protein TBLA_0I01160 [Tetrapisispora blattae CBS 6284]